METVKIILQITTLFGIGSIFLFRKFLFSYSSEKGKNLATKEDIEDITRKVESTKNEYIADIERLKVELLHLTALHEIEQEDFIFLSESSKAILSELHYKCSMMCSMELAVCANSEDKDIIESTIPVYEAAMLNIDLCLQSLYEELEFPSKEKAR
ncbi:hypothetical protein ACWOHQ_004762 [Vibrio parahaemolyticus]